MTAATTLGQPGLGDTLADAATMLGRELRHSRRYPMMLIASVVMPVVMLALFVYVFGGALSRGLAAAGTTGRYVDYLVPGILVMTIAAGMSTISIGVSADMTKGIVDRLRSMPVARSAVPAGHVVGGVLRMSVTVGVVIGAAVAMGFRPAAGPWGWLGVAGVVALVAFALSWVSVAIGLAASTPAGANSGTLPFQFILPFMSSAFVPPATMPAGPRWFAEHQPFTPIVESLRGMLVGGPVAGHVVAVVLWCAVLAAAGAAWARASLRRDTAR